MRTKRRKVGPVFSGSELGGWSRVFLSDEQIAAIAYEANRDTTT
jgi:hypothetical protein